MLSRSRATALLAFVALPAVLFAGCGTGSGAGNSGTLTPIQPSSYVTLPPATTTTTTTLAPGSEGADGPTNSEQEQQYTVVTGDSVYRIAEIHGVDPEVLATYNKWPEGIQHPLTPGDIVLIPPGALVPGTGDTGGSSGDVGGGDTGDTGDTGGDDGEDSGDTSSGCAYTIVAGDNPSKVAEKFDITVDELRAANSESVMSSFLVGATLQIPAGADCSAAEN